MLDQINITDEERCTVHNPKEIGQILVDLANNKSMINVTFNQGQDQCLTRIIGVDRLNLCAYMDIGIDEGFNQRLLASNYVMFSKEDGVKIKWASKQVQMVRLKDGYALKIIFPASLVRLQRREFFRLKTPIINPMLCNVPVVDEEQPDMAIPLDVTLLDISLGGIGTVAVSAIPHQLKEGSIYENCKLTIPDMGVAYVTLCVRNINQIKSYDFSIKYRIGFEFIYMNKEHQALIHRCVSKLERDAIAMAKRM